MAALAFLGVTALLLVLALVSHVRSRPRASIYLTSLAMLLPVAYFAVGWSHLYYPSAR